MIRLGELLTKREPIRQLTPAIAIERLRSDRMQRDVAAAKAESAEVLPLRDYIRQAWNVVEPATEFVSNWHIDAIADHLEAVVNGQILRLLINMPPRHMKSISISVMWPTHVWTYNPAFRWLFASYAQGLSTRDAVKSRRVINSPWYQERWGTRYQLTGDQNEKMRYENDRTGYRISTSVDGSATGEGGDAVVADDPHNVREGHSEIKRDSVIDWWDQTMSTRLNDPKTGRMVIVMQRVHESDLSGHVLDSKTYTHLCLPTEFDQKRICVTPIGWKDPREEKGQLLWPDRFGTNEVAGARKTLGSYGYSAQHQQSPSPEEGGIFKRAWFRVVHELPKGEPLIWCRFWDCAGTIEDGDYTVGTKICKSLMTGMFYVAHLVRGQWSPKVVNDTIHQTATVDGPRVRIREEQEGGSSGKTVIAARTLLLAGYDYKGYPASGDKEFRARPFAIQAEAGNVCLLAADWNQEWLDEYANFPFAGHDDQVDSGSGAFNELALGGKKKATVRGGAA